MIAATIQATPPPCVMRLALFTTYIKRQGLTDRHHRKPTRVKTVNIEQNVLVNRIWRQISKHPTGSKQDVNDGTHQRYRLGKTDIREASAQQNKFRNHPRQHDGKCHCITYQQRQQTVTPQIISMRRKCKLPTKDGT